MLHTVYLVGHCVQRSKCILYHEAWIHFLNLHDSCMQMLASLPCTCTCVLLYTSLQARAGTCVDVSIAIRSTRSATTVGTAEVATVEERSVKEKDKC